MQTISKLLFSWQHSIEFGCRLYCLHGKRVVTIEYGTGYIVFMANVLLVSTEYGCRQYIFHGKRVVNIEYGLAKEELKTYSKRVSVVGCRGCINYGSDKALGIN